MSGVRASVTRLHGMSGGDAWGLMLWTEGEEYSRSSVWSTRGIHQLGIGGGSAGLEGMLYGSWAGGVRLPVGQGHGPLLRVGLHGYLQGNDSYYGSLLEVPQLQLGYQYLRGSTLVEFGAKTGAVLAGRRRIGDARRVLGSGLEYGGYGALQLPRMRAGVEVTRLPVDDELSAPVDVAEGTLCARAAPFAICADARATFTEAVNSPGEPASEVHSVYAGLLLGFTHDGETPRKRPATGGRVGAGPDRTR